MRAPVVAVLLCSLVAACAHAPKKASVSLAPGTIVDAREVPVSDDALVARARLARYVLIGEGHDQPCDHAAEARLFDLVASSGGGWALGLEMVSVSRQDVLDRFHAQTLDLAGLEAALAWKTSWGYDFAMYAPLFASARSHDAPVIALSTTKEAEQAAREDRYETFVAAHPPGLAPAIVPPPPAEHAVLREAFDAHRAHLPPGTDPEASFRSFERVQALWDTQMAFRAVDAIASNAGGIVIVAGAGHVGHGWGIASRLRAQDPAAVPLLLVPWRGDGPPDASEADLFVVCPAP